MRILRCDNCQREYKVPAALETGPADLMIPGNWYHLGRNGWLPDHDNDPRAEILLCTPICLKVYVETLGELGEQRRLEDV